MPWGEGWRGRGSRQAQGPFFFRVSPALVIFLLWPGCCTQADGYAEAIVRGFRSAFITEDEYHHLTQCETIEGGGGVALL
jgi:hypothetical protein